MRKGLISGGNWIVDHVKIIDTWPSQDALASIKSQSDGTGGSPYNILVDLAILDRIKVASNVGYNVVGTASAFWQARIDNLNAGAHQRAMRN